MITLEEFLAGEGLRCRLGTADTEYEIFYRAGVGVLIEHDGVRVGVADVTDDVGARRLFELETRWRVQT